MQNYINAAIPENFCGGANPLRPAQGERAARSMGSEVSVFKLKSDVLIVIRTVGDACAFDYLENLAGLVGEHVAAAQGAAEHEHFAVADELDVASVG